MRSHRRPPVACLLLTCLLLAACPGKRGDEDRDGGKSGDGLQDNGPGLELGGGGEAIPAGLAKDGKWKGKYISFTVLKNGTEVWLHDLDYTKCTKDGCEDTQTLTNCQLACNVPIKGGVFNITKHKINGTFTSATTASGTGTEAGEFCGCTIKVNWTASWVSK